MFNKHGRRIRSLPRSSTFVISFTIISFLLLSSLIGWQALIKAEHEAEQEIHATLDSVLTATHESLTIWKGTIETQAQSFANHPTVVSITEQQLAAPSAANVKALHSFYNSNKFLFNSVGFSIIGHNNTMIAKLGDQRTGKQSAKSINLPLAIKKALDGDTVFTPSIQTGISTLQKKDKNIKSATLFVSTPVYDHNNNIIAALSIGIDPYKIFSKITSLGRVGKTGRSFAFDLSGKSVNEALFKTEGIQSVKENIDSHNNISSHIEPTSIAQAIWQSKTDKYITHYANNNVYGSLIWDNEVSMGLATEISHQEAMQKYNQTSDTIFTLLITMIVIAIAIFGITMNTSYLSNRSLKNIKKSLQDKITKRTQELLESNKQLAKTRNNLETLIQSLPDAIVSCDHTGKLIHFNQRAMTLFGYTETELRNIKIDDLIPSNYRPAHSEAIKSFFKGRQRRGINEREFYATNKLGKEFPVSITINSFESDGQTIAIANIRDITLSKQAAEEKEKMLQQLTQSQKMKTIGQLAAGIAHDFNNILTSIMGHSEISLEAANENDMQTIVDCQATILATSNQAKKIAHQLLMFGRNNIGNTEKIHPSEVIHDAIGMLRACIPPTIKITTHLPEEELSINTNPVQLNQAIVNLVINARDALDNQGRGEIEIGLKHDYTKGECNSCHETFAGNFVEIYIKDNGTGIKQEMLNRVFDPFFTTKSVGTGSGMGLSMVHGIIHGSNGHIIIETSDTGTNFRLLIPHNSSEQDVSDRHYLGSTESINPHIMVIDDEKPVTEVIKTMLQKAGYNADAYTDAKKALSDLRSQKKTYCLVVTDLVMPTLTGVELTKIVAEEFPEIPVILFSGFSTHIDQTPDLFGASAFFSKPLDMQAFLATTQSLVSRRAASS